MVGHAQSIRGRRRAFIDATLQTVREALNAQRLAFYSVDGDGNLYDFVIDSMPREFHHAYLREMFAYDPLHVRHLGPQTNVAKFADAASYAPAEHVDAYTQFLRRFEVADTIELVFHDAQGIAAGINVAWTSNDERPARLEPIAQALQRYIELNLTSFSVPHRDPVLDAVHDYGLTARELSVAQLVCLGRTNPQIAVCLGIGLATVKTHLLHIFDKCGVETRAALVARLHRPGG